MGKKPKNKEYIIDDFAIHEKQERTNSYQKNKKYAKKRKANRSHQDGREND